MVASREGIGWLAVGDIPNALPSERPRVLCAARVSLASSLFNSLVVNSVCAMRPRFVLRFPAYLCILLIILSGIFF